MSRNKSKKNKSAKNLKSLKKSEKAKSDAPLTLDEKYYFYENSVQNVEGEVETLSETFEELMGRKARVLREDFCGTGALMCEWAKSSKDREAFGLDLDPEPIELGKQRHYSKLKESEQKRVHYYLNDVLKPGKVAKSVDPDLVVALNFSYFIFKKREDLKAYFKSVCESLKGDGLFVLDLFGGPESQTLLEERTDYDDFSYFWDCERFNPITHECLFSIHFKPKKGKKHKRVFSYDWRFWTFPELRDLLTEAGFSEVHAYWEGDDDDGGGNGEFKKTVDVENCDSWVAYIAAKP